MTTFKCHINRCFWAETAENRKSRCKPNFQFTMEKFKKFALDDFQAKMIKGGDTCSACLQSAEIVCMYSCGGCWAQCVNNQQAQCLAQSYCQ